MGFLSKIKSPFGLKKSKRYSYIARAENKNSSRSATTRELNISSHGNTGGSQLTRVNQPVQRASSVWSTSPVTGKKFHRGDDFNTQDHAHNETPIGSGVPGVPGEYLNCWPNFDGTYIVETQVEGISEDEMSEVGNDDLDTTSSFGFFAPREGEYRAGHVEELETLGLKRSNAVRQKTSPSMIHTKYSDAERSQPGPTARRFSWVLPTDQLIPSFEEVMARGQEARRFRAADGEVEFIRAESSKPCPIREATMRKATLARLEGRR